MLRHRQVHFLRLAPVLRLPRGTGQRPNQSAAAGRLRHHRKPYLVYMLTMMAHPYPYPCPLSRLAPSWSTAIWVSAAVTPGDYVSLLETHLDDRSTSTPSPGFSLQRGCNIRLLPVHVVEGIPFPPWHKYPQLSDEPSTLLLSLVLYAILCFLSCISLPPPLPRFPFLEQTDNTVSSFILFLP